MKQREMFFDSIQACCQDRLSASGQYGDYNKGSAIAKRIMNNLRIFFKDQSIRTISMCLGIPDKLLFH